MSVQRNIIIGADAKQFNKAMGQVKQGMGEVSTSTVAMGAGVAGGIAMAAQAMRQFYNQSIDMALALPKGFNAGVDAANEYDKKLKNIQTTIGINLVEANTWFDETIENFYLWAAGASSTESNWGDILTSFTAGANGIAASAKLMSIGLAESAVNAGKLEEYNKKEDARQARIKRMMDKGKEWLKTQEKAAEAAKKAADAAAYEKWNREGINELLKQQLEMDIFTPKAPDLSVDFISLDQISEMKDLFSEAFDPLEIMDFQKNLDDLAIKQQRSRDLALGMGDAFQIAAGFITTSLSNAYGAMGNFIGGLIEMVAQVVAANLAMSTANAITAGTQSGAATGPFAVLTTPAFIATMLGVVTSAFAGITKMAHGGIVSKPTTVMAGEAGPEAIIPLSKLSNMGGGNLTTRVSGRDLLILLEREMSLKQRTYG